MSLRLQRILTAWLFAAALVLKAAVPWLAATAAQWQGVPVAEVCSLYGVATSPPAHAAHHHAAGHDHAAAGHGGESQPHPTADHGHDHCALSAIAAMAAGQVALPLPALHGRLASASRDFIDPTLPDDCARWMACLAHGPPVRA